jgi:hypothetical protein
MNGVFIPMPTIFALLLIACLLVKVIHIIHHIITEKSSNSYERATTFENVEEMTQRERERSAIEYEGCQANLKAEARKAAERDFPKIARMIKDAARKGETHCYVDPYRNHPDEIELRKIYFKRINELIDTPGFHFSSDGSHSGEISW